MFPRSFAVTAFMAFVLTASAAASGEDVALTGRVLTESGRPAEAAQVSISGGGYGVVTTADGRYSLQLGAAWVGREVTLRVQLPGYTEARRTLTLDADNNTVDFALQQQRVAHESTSRWSRTAGRDALVEAFPSPHAESDFVAVTARPRSTFAIDVGRASYADVRRFIAEGRRPPIDAVRIEELVNYFTYDDPAPADGEPFSVTAEVARAPWQPAHQLVRIGVKGRGMELGSAPPNNLVLLVDVSGSMAAADKLPLLENALSVLVDRLRPQDRLAIVVYAGAEGLVLPSTPGSERQTILDALQSLEAGGSTAGGGGIHLAYGVATAQHILGGNNRVILATDGDLNVGPSGDGEMIRLIERKRDQGTFLTVLGFGLADPRDARMARLAERGNGSFANIDSPLEARRVLLSEMGGSLATMGRDVRVQVGFNPDRVAAYRLIGYDSEPLPRGNVGKDARSGEELGAGHSATALYEIVPKGVETPAHLPLVGPLAYPWHEPQQTTGDDREIVSVELRYEDPAGGGGRLVTRGVEDVQGETSDDFRFAAAVAAWGMMLRDSEHCEHLTLDDVVRMASGALGDDPEGYRAEFVDLVSRARSMGVLSQRVGMR
jgi:Ca-activated chloride channel homolog